MEAPEKERILCGICDEEELHDSLVCDYCNQGFHLKCLNVSLEEVMEYTDWFCLPCRIILSNKSDRVRELDRNSSWWPLGHINPIQEETERRNPKKEQKEKMSGNEPREEVVHDVEESPGEGTSYSPILRTLAFVRAHLVTQRIRFPFSVGEVRVHSLGKINTGDGYHNKRYIWPPGYCVTWQCPTHGHMVKSEIVEGDQGPLFKISLIQALTSEECTTETHKQKNTVVDDESSAQITSLLHEFNPTSEEPATSEFMEGNIQTDPLIMNSGNLLFSSEFSPSPNIIFTVCEPAMVHAEQVFSSRYLQYLIKESKNMSQFIHRSKNINSNKMNGEDSELVSHKKFDELSTKKWFYFTDEISRLIEGLKNANHCKNYIFRAEVNPHSSHFHGAQQLESSLLKYPFNLSGSTGPVLTDNLFARDKFSMMHKHRASSDSLSSAHGAISIGKNLPSFLIRDIVRIWNFLAYHWKVFGFKKPLTYKEFEYGLLFPNPMERIRKENPTNLLGKNDNDVEELEPKDGKNLPKKDHLNHKKSHAFPESPNLSQGYLIMVKVHSALLHILAMDMNPDIAQEEGNSLLNNQNIHKKSQTYPLNNHQKSYTSGFEKLSQSNRHTIILDNEANPNSDELVYICPSNGVMFSEVVRRAMLTSLGIKLSIGTGKNPLERGSLSRSVGGDGGMLLGVEVGVCGAESDAKALAMAEMSLEKHMRLNDEKLSNLDRIVKSKRKFSDAFEVPETVDSNPVSKPSEINVKSNQTSIENPPQIDINFPPPTYYNLQVLETTVDADTKNQNATTREMPKRNRKNRRFEEDSEWIDEFDMDDVVNEVVNDELLPTQPNDVGVSDVSNDELIALLEPIRKMPTNVGSRIRNIIKEALEMNIPNWIRTKLEWSISKEVYKGNAAGPTKKACVELLDLMSGNPAEPKKFSNHSKSQTPKTKTKPRNPVDQASQTKKNLKYSEISPFSHSKLDPELKSFPSAKDIKPKSTIITKLSFKFQDSPLPHKFSRIVSQCCRVILSRLANADYNRYFCYFWGLGLSISDETHTEQNRVFHEPREKAWEIIPPQNSFSNMLQTQGNGLGFLDERYGTRDKRPMSRPMDFRTIDLRVKHGAYGSRHEFFAADILQIWSNVKSSYEPSHPIYQSSVILSNLFESEYNAMISALHDPLETFPGKSDKPVLSTQSDFNKVLETLFTKENSNRQLESLGNSSYDTQAPNFLTPDEKGDAEILDLEKKLKPWLEEIPCPPWEKEGCRVCAVDEDESKVLLCDGCDSEYHMYCLSPPLNSVPEGNWYCPGCVEKGKPLNEEDESKEGRDTETKPNDSEWKSHTDFELNSTNEIAWKSMNNKENEKTDEVKGRKNLVTDPFCSTTTNEEWEYWDEWKKHIRKGMQEKQSRQFPHILNVLKKHSRVSKHRLLIEKLSYFEYWQLSVYERVSVLKILCHAVAEASRFKNLVQSLESRDKIVRKPRSNSMNRKRTKSISSFPFLSPDASLESEKNRMVSNPEANTLLSFEVDRENEESSGTEKDLLAVSKANETIPLQPHLEENNLTNSGKINEKNDEEHEKLMDGVLTDERNLKRKRDDMDLELELKPMYGREFLGRDDWGRGYWGLGIKNLEPSLIIQIPYSENNHAPSSDPLSGGLGSLKNLNSKALDSGCWPRGSLKESEDWEEWLLFEGDQSIDEVLSVLERVGCVGTITHSISRWKKNCGIGKGTREEEKNRISAKGKEFENANTSSSNDSHYFLPTTNASAVLEERYGKKPFRDRSTPFLNPARSDASMIESERFDSENIEFNNRCLCLEPLWPSKWHCSICHESYFGKDDILMHKNECIPFFPIPDYHDEPKTFNRSNSKDSASGKHEANSMVHANDIPSLFSSPPNIPSSAILLSERSMEIGFGLQDWEEGRTEIHDIHSDFPSTLIPTLHSPFPLISSRDESEIPLNEENTHPNISLIPPSLTHASHNMDSIVDANVKDNDVSRDQLLLASDLDASQSTPLYPSSPPLDQNDQHFPESPWIPQDHSIDSPSVPMQKNYLTAEDLASMGEILSFAAVSDHDFHELQDYDFFPSTNESDVWGNSFPTILDTNYPHFTEIPLAEVIMDAIEASQERQFSKNKSHCSQASERLTNTRLFHISGFERGENCVKPLKNSSDCTTKNRFVLLCDLQMRSKSRERKDEPFSSVFYPLNEKLEKEKSLPRMSENGKNEFETHSLDSKLASNNEAVTGVQVQSDMELNFKLDAQSRFLLQKLKADLLDMEAALPPNSLCIYRGTLSRRRGFRSFVKCSSSLEELGQACILLECMIKSDNLNVNWRFWHSFSSAVSPPTIAALAFRIHALDQAILYSQNHHHRNPLSPPSASTIATMGRQPINKNPRLKPLIPSHMIVDEDLNIDVDGTGDSNEIKKAKKYRNVNQILLETEGENEGGNFATNQKAERYFVAKANATEDYGGKKDVNKSEFMENVNSRGRKEESLDDDEEQDDDDYYDENDSEYV